MNFEQKFDLITGTKTMKELGIKLDFKNDVITIDSIHLPMCKIKDLQKPNIVYQMYKNQENLKILSQLYSNMSRKAEKSCPKEP